MKRNRTIFISLLSNVVIDNFSIPNGVFDELVRQKPADTVVVFLTSPIFLPRLQKYLSNSVIVEYIEKRPPEGLLQKTFQFFYSYLIFTGTTKILATFGARVDTPPAARNRHVAAIKWLIARTFGRSPWIKIRLIPWLYDRVFRSRPYKQLFDRHNPTLVFAPNIAFFPDIELVAEAKRQRIRTLGMAINWDHLNKYYIPLHVDHLLVQNEPMMDEAVELHGYNSEDVTIVGFPQFDMYSRIEDYLLSKKEFYSKFNIPEKSKLILFISGAAYSQDEPDILKSISSWIQSGELKSCHLMLRPYIATRDAEAEKKKYAGFEQNPFVSINWYKGGESEEGRRAYLSMFFWSDIVISLFSTTAIEAALLDKPTITIGFDGYKKRPYHRSIRRLEDMAHFKHVLETGSVRVTRNFNELRSSIAEYIRYPETGRAAREALVKKMCYATDGQSSCRVVKHIFAHNDHVMEGYM